MSEDNGETPPGVSLMTCSECGCLVPEDQSDKHTAWHDPFPEDEA